MGIGDWGLGKDKSVGDDVFVCHGALNHRVDGM